MGLPHPADGSAPGYFGLYPAFVTNLVDSANLGRVEVSLPWLGTDGNRDVRAWATLCSPYADNNQGLEILPEVGSQVLVAFEAGNLRRPYIIGAAWNGKESLPNTPDSANNLRVWQSRSGSRLEFDDSTAAQGVHHHEVGAQGGARRRGPADLHHPRHGLLDHAHRDRHRDQREHLGQRDRPDGQRECADIDVQRHRRGQDGRGGRVCDLAGLHTRGGEPAMTGHAFAFRAPWYVRERKNIGLRDPGALRPAIQMYDSPRFVDQVTKDPRVSLKFTPDDRWSYPVPASFPAGSGRARFATHKMVRTGLRKLYQPNHDRFYLVVAELFCDEPGLPRAARTGTSPSTSSCAGVM